VPLKPSNFFGATYSSLRTVNVVPFQPFHEISCQLGRPWASTAPLMYSLPWCQATPATNLSRLPIFTAWPFLSTYTPPFGGAEPSELPPSPTNTLPSPKANDVGVFSPDATSSTLWPLVETGGGGPELALATGAPSAKARAAARPSTPNTRLNMTTPPI